MVCTYLKCFRDSEAISGLLSGGSAPPKRWLWTIRPVTLTQVTWLHIFDRSWTWLAASVSLWVESQTQTYKVQRPKEFSDALSIVFGWHVQSSEETSESSAVPSLEASRPRFPKRGDLKGRRTHQNHPESQSRCTWWSYWAWLLRWVLSPSKQTRVLQPVAKMNYYCNLLLI